MAKEYELAKEVVDFLYSGSFAFFPNFFYPPDQKIQPAVFYFGKNKEDFQKIILKITGANSIENAIQIIKNWKIAAERGEKIKSTVPVNIEDLIETYEEQKEKTSEPRKTTETIIRHTEERAKIKEKIPTPKEETIKNAKATVEEINLYSFTPPPVVKITKEQQKVIKLAHSDPQGFADQLTKKIIETSNLDKNNPLEISSAQTAAYLFTTKLLNIDPKNPEVLVDASPFETLAFFANPDNGGLAQIIPDQKTREKIAQASLSAAYILEKDTTITANFVNQALGQDWSSFFIPPTIRQTNIVTPGEKPPEGSININLKNFLEQVASFQTLEKQIRKSVIDDKTYLELSKPERAILEKEIKEAARKVTSASRAFNFITGGKKVPSFQGEIPTQNTGWLSTQFSILGIPSFEQNQLIASSFNFGSFSSPNIISSPIFNFAFNKFLTKIPAVTKLNTAVSGMTAKLSAKVAAKMATTKLGTAIAANVIPAIGQVISAISIALSLKDLTIALKVWIKKNEDKIPFIIAVFLIGGFALTGAPIYLIAGAGVLGVTRASYIGTFVGGLFIALGSIVLSSLLIPALIVLIGIPIVVAIILFIINSGAYVYPPSTKQASFGPGAIINEYIEVTKVAYAEKYPEKGKSSSLEFENSNLPLEITYEVTIKAKKGTLTNIKIEENCNVTKENSSPSCPIANPSIPNGSNIQEISASSPYTFTYKKNFEKSTFEDSLVIDTITVTADTPEEKGVSTAGSASIKIGNPPDECPNNAWPIANLGGLNLVTQGPLARGCSHERLRQAIDIGVDGAQVIAVHSGNVIVGQDSCIGKYVKIESTCGSTTFYSLYAHLGAVSVSTGQKVSVGQTIGISDNTGTCTTGPHLHFEFKTSGNIPAVQKPYLVRDIPIGCCSTNTCN
ncbi:MAG: hypothetical protein KatS3mg088_130 [Patescibacteria group bacterium]|nr:MAG: hypothetical protein KatS3mg088_130 [Patescibacteria group bacterium]